jgi:SAM-dependent methyltransferase
LLNPAAHAALQLLDRKDPKMTDFEPHRADAFAEQVLGILNGGALALMLSLGHRAGLFDAMRRLDFAPSRTLAEAAGLHERNVREWLGAMVTAGIVEYDAGARSYRLPPEHAAVLCRDTACHNLAATAQWIPLLARVEDELLSCFERGGGVPYSSYDRFHQVMAEDSDQTVVAAMFDGVLPLVPGLAEELARGIDVLDVGCGSGRVLHALAKRFPNSRFTGYELSSEAVAEARAGAADGGLRNTRFEVRDVADLAVQRSFDLITAFDAIHDQARPVAALRVIAAALREDGVFLMQEIRASSRVEEDVHLPLAPFLYTVSCMHCMTVSLAAGGAGLGAMWGTATARRMLEEAGFAKLEIHTVPRDMLNQYTVARLRG